MSTLQLDVDGVIRLVPDDGSSLLDVIRDHLGLRSAKDGCSPQGQCGCCTVWVDGAPRVACVTPARRVAGRRITTLEGLDATVRDAWVGAFAGSGASQCGFCTPGIIMRLAALSPRPGEALAPAEVERALLAHLCRCTGWRTIVEAATSPPAAPPARDSTRAARRAAIEGRTPQQVGAEIVAGRAGFADDSAPPDALVAVPRPGGGWAVGETLREARARAGKVQGRRTTEAIRHPLEVPEGEWDLTLRTTWVEPAYLELDASWCRPGGEPASPLANGGAFGGKLESIAPAAARELADAHGRPVRVLLSREDSVRLGPKRPPIAAGVLADGTGVMRVVRTPGIAQAVISVAPGLTVEEVEVTGPPTSSAVRGAGWVEAAVLQAAVGRRVAGEVRLESPSGAVAEAAIGPRGEVEVRVACGEVLDEVVLRSYCIGAAHMALGWVRSESLAVDECGDPRDLTIRSFGILRARETPEVHVELVGGEGPPVNGSEAIFAAVAAAAWLADGCPQDWPTNRAAT